MGRITQGISNFIDRITHSARANTTGRTDASGRAGRNAAPLDPPTLPSVNTFRSHGTYPGLALHARERAGLTYSPVSIVSTAITAGNRQAIADYGQSLNGAPCPFSIRPLLDLAITRKSSAEVKPAIAGLPGANATELLGLAIKHKDAQLAAHLLQRNADSAGKTSMLSHIAVKGENTALVKQLLQRGQNPSHQQAEQLFRLAVKCNDAELTAQLFRQITFRI